jgi:hypothetical protein
LKKMVDFKKDTWLYALIAFILLVISMFTPWGSLDVGPYVVQSWMGGVVQYAGDPADVWFGNGATLWTLGITAFCAGLFLFYGLHGWKGMEFKWDWLVYLLAGIALIIFPIIALVLESTEDGIIGFAPIGVIIAGVVSILAFVMDKFMGRGA